MTGRVFSVLWLGAYSGRHILTGRSSEEVGLGTNCQSDTTSSYIFLSLYNIHQIEDSLAGNSNLDNF